MITVKEYDALEQILRRGRLLKFSALGYLAVGLIAGIPVNDRPLLAIPAAAALCLVVAGIFWSVMIGAIVTRGRARCPRCHGLFFNTRRTGFLPFGVRAIWGRRCGGCGLSLREIEAKHIHDAAEAMVRASALALTAPPPVPIQPRPHLALVPRPQANASLRNRAPAFSRRER